LKLLLQPLKDCVTADADFVMMVKPQYEVGKEKVSAGGVIRDPELRADAVGEVAAYALTLGLGVLDVVASALPGSAGNVEYFLWLRAGEPPLDEVALTRAIKEGPR